MAIKREVKEGELRQGVDEQVYYKLTTTPWGSTPTSVAVTAYKRETTGAWTDVTTTVLSGAASVMGDVITLPKLSGLTAGQGYRLEIKFTVSGNVLETYVNIMGEK